MKFTILLLGAFMLFCFVPTLHAQTYKHIPKDADIMAVANLELLSSRVEWPNDPTKKDEYKSIFRSKITTYLGYAFADAVITVFDDPSAAGIDMQRMATLHGHAPNRDLNDNDKKIGLCWTVPLKDRAIMESLLVNTAELPAPKKIDNWSYTDMRNRFLFIWNDEYLHITFPMSMRNYDEIGDWAPEFIAQISKVKQTITARAGFATAQKDIEKAPIGWWTSERLAKDMTKIYASGDDTPYAELYHAFTSTILMSGTADFVDGEILLSFFTDNQSNKPATKYTTKISSGYIAKEFFKYIPAKDVYAHYAMHLNLDQMLTDEQPFVFHPLLISDISMLPLLESSSTVKRLHDNFNDPEWRAILQHFTGDVFVALHDVTAQLEQKEVWSSEKGDYEMVLQPSFYPDFTAMFGYHKANRDSLRKQIDIVIAMSAMVGASGIDKVDANTYTLEGPTPGTKTFLYLAQDVVFLSNHEATIDRAKTALGLTDIDKDMHYNYMQFQQSASYDIQKWAERAERMRPNPKQYPAEKYPVGLTEYKLKGVRFETLPFVGKRGKHIISIQLEDASKAGLASFFLETLVKARIW